MDTKKIKESYDKNGHFKVEGFFSQEEIDQITKDLTELQNEDSVAYLDENSILRRLEQVAYKRPSLKKANEKILALLNEVVGDEMVLFKDKYNVKPPKGEGFYAHYDGIFIWEDENGNKRNGWHEYAEEFFNVLIAIDKCDAGNGTLEVSNEIHSDMTFDQMLEQTYKNGTPQLKQEVEDEITFYKVDLNPGDIVFFSNRCPHRSEANNSDSRYRRILYYTYNRLSDGDNYKQYFKDKATSNKNSTTSKALSFRKEEKN